MVGDKGKHLSIDTYENCITHEDEQYILLMLLTQIILLSSIMIFYWTCHSGNFAVIVLDFS